MRVARPAGLLVVGCLMLMSPVATPSAVAAPCNPGRGLQQLPGEPWAQTRFDFDRVWEFTKGAGVTVAVVDSGIDTGHPQLAGRVAAEVDFSGTGKRDCLGHGTAVAGIIGARDMRSENRPLVGVAPEARLLSVKFTNQQSTSGVDPNLAKAIRRAADMDADVINVSAEAPDSAELLSAVKYAQRKDAVIVAAPGNVDPETKEAEQEKFPASYPGVISVGGVDQQGQHAESSNVMSLITVSAPGKQVATTWPGGDYAGLEGTSFAAPFVSGVAALVRAYRPDLTYEQVKRRIEETADGSAGTGTGAGMVNPLNAVTAELVANGRTARRGPTQPVEIAQPVQPDGPTRVIALVVTVVAVGLAVAVAAAGIVTPMGRRRGWRPGRVPPRAADGS